LTYLWSESTIPEFSALCPVQEQILPTYCNSDS